MHLLIPFAGTLAPAGLQTLDSLRLPHLAALLAQLMPGELEGSDEYSLTPPHERALATVLGWQGDDGFLPWAAHAATQDGIDTGQAAWGQLTPVHWQLSADHTTLADPQTLHLSAQDSRALFDAVKPLFESEGCNFVFGAPLRWYVSHDSLQDLATASLDRVIGRAIDVWMPQGPNAALMRRLQNEAQMLLYQHPLNDERMAAGQLPVNSFWLSGCGRAQPQSETMGLHIAEQLRAPALAGNWHGFGEAWHALDANILKNALAHLQQGAAFSLTLCGERFAQHFTPVKRSLWSRLTQGMNTPPVAPVLAAL